MLTRHNNFCLSFLIKTWIINLIMFHLLGCSNTPQWDELPVNDFHTLAAIQKNGDAGLEAIESLMMGGVSSEYRVGPNDELAISVWGRPDLGSQIVEGQSSQRRITVVNDNGEITLPFIASLNVTGLTVDEIRSRIHDAYAKLIDTSEVEVQITSYKSQAVHVEGAVQKAGKVFLSSYMRTLGDVINAAGGFSNAADITRAELVRDGVKYQFDYYEILSNDTLAYKLIMKNGDKIYFPLADTRMVYVFGEVIQPRKVNIPPSGMNLADVLAAVSGPNVITGDVDGIYFIRPSNPEDSKLFRLSLSEILEGPEISVRPMDRVYIAPTGLTVWDRVWRQLLPFFTAGASTSYAVEVAEDEEN